MTSFPLRNKRGIFLPAMALFALLLLASLFWTFYHKKETFTKTVGDEHVALIESYLDAEKDLYILDQSASYALQRAYEDLVLHNGQLPDSPCLIDGGTLVLYSPPDCTFDDRVLQPAFASFFEQHFAFYLARFLPSYTVDDYQLSFFYEDSMIRVRGNTEQTTRYETPFSNYSVPFDFDVVLPASFAFFREILNTLSASKDCLRDAPYNALVHDASFLPTTCALDPSFTWSVTKKDGLLTASVEIPTTPPSVSSLPLHFAIHLNSLN